MKRTQTMLITTVILSIALTSVFAFDFENNDTNTVDAQIPFAAEAKSGDTHNITMEAVAMPDGLYAYRMISYTMNDSVDDLVGTQYSDKPSIPGPTIIMTEGDNAIVTLTNSACENSFVDGPNFPVPILPTFSENSMIGMHVHGVHYDISDDATYSRMNMDESSGATCGEDITYDWVAAPGTSGAWPYHDHMFSINEVGAEELGLFGTIIINPANGKVNGLVDDGSGKVKDVKVNDIEKDFVLWMVSSEVLGRSIFYGNEIDYSTTQYDKESIGIRESALWTNPNLVATDGKIYRFHVLGLGEETHAFHLHGHRWTEEIHEKSTAEDIIDVKEIVPLQRHTFIVKASDNDAADKKHDGPEGWMYHCHFTDHMKQGMSGMMHILPEYQDDDIPIIGATFTLSDEPGLWMKTLDAGVADQLDDILQTVFDAEEITPESFKPNKGTGYPLGYVSDALGELIPAAKTDFSYSEGRSLAIINPGETVNFGMKDSQTKHTITTLIYPTAAENLGGNGLLTTIDSTLGTETSHFDTQLGIRGSTLLYDRQGMPTGLDEPGLYVFVCKIHPYMFSAVIVDDPNTHLQLLGNPAYDFPLLDLSDDLTVLTRASNPVEFPPVANYPTSFPTTGVAPTDLLATELLKTFYVITDPNNWRDYDESTWDVSLPPVLVTTNTENLVAGLVYNKDTTEFAIDTLNLTNSTGGEIPVEEIHGLSVGVFGMPNDADFTPAPGIGEVWVNTQFETTLNKNHDGTPSDKPGTITVVNAGTWDVERKIALPEINMNHPHNMWTDTKNEVIYQTQWFGNEMAVIDRESGELIKEVFTGQSPSHVMTAPDTGKIYVAINGEESVNEFDPETLEMTRQLSTGFRSHPHGHWVSSSGDYIVTPDFLGLKASILDVETGAAYSSNNVLYGPIATGMKGDESVFYTADFLGNANTEIDTSTGTILSQINWLKEGADRGLGLVGLPIQTPISPDDQYMVTALTLGGKVGVVDVSTSPARVTGIFNCDPGCHGVQWGAKSGEGYYAYVSSKFSNSMIIVDPNPDNDIESDDAAVVGRINLSDDNADSDDRIIGYGGFGGQGVLAIPNVYEGWIEKTVSACDITADPDDVCGDVSTYVEQLSTLQSDPITP